MPNINPTERILAQLAQEVYILVRNTLPAMVYIELGNIRNAKDQKRILNYETEKLWPIGFVMGS